jgi:riboflavin synthase
VVKVFTGIVAEIGTVERITSGPDGARIRVRTALAGDVEAGDSVAVNGACLTAAAVDGESFEADVMNQTLTQTSLGDLDPDAPVNLELAVRAGERLGGHLVQGHVDGTGRVTAVAEDGFARRVSIKAPEELRPLIADRGSVAVDGVSLTVAAASEDAFEVSLVPETLERTTLGAVAEGDVVNLEVDVVARYVERLVSGFVVRERSDG